MIEILGLKVYEIIADYPYLETEDIEPSLAYRVKNKKNDRPSQKSDRIKSK